MVFAYSFLVLCVLLAIPGAIVWFMRPDLRVVIHRMALASLPFALTERLFYPVYWEPRFLFDLVNIIGFGIEDVLFVVGLAAFTSTAWPFVMGRRLEPLATDAQTKLSPLKMALIILTICFVMVAIIALIGMPMIYGAPIIMTVIAFAICLFRKDLLLPSLGGAAITTLVYTGLCIVLAALIPDVFALDWKTDQFLNAFILGVPVEELLYASTSGLIATAFYPFVTSQKFVSQPPHRSADV